MATQPPKRSSNKRRIERRAASWARSQKRKKKRRDDNELRAMENKQLVADGGTLAWKKAQAARFRFRHRRCRMGAACRLNTDFQHTATNSPLWGRKA